MNVNEHRVFKTLIKLAANLRPAVRLVFASDSMVSSAVAAKGRSSSGALTAVQRGVIAHALGSGSLRVGSMLNPADEPSRGVPLRRPCRETPRLGRGSVAGLNVVAAADRFPRPLCFWARLLFRATSRGFDATLG